MGRIDAESFDHYVSLRIAARVQFERLNSVYVAVRRICDDKSLSGRIVAEEELSRASEQLLSRSVEV